MGAAWDEQMTAHPPDLRRAWFRWFVVLEKLAERRLLRKQLTPIDYGMLRDDLLSACRSYQAHPDPQIANAAREMALFVDPWINLDILCGTEDKLIRDLVREGVAKFGHRRRLPQVNFTDILKLLKILTGIGLMVTAILYWQMPDLFTAFFDWSRGILRSVLRFSETSRTTFYLLVVLFGAAVAYILNSARRF